MRKWCTSIALSACLITPLSVFSQTQSAPAGNQPQTEQAQTQQSQSLGRPSSQPAGSTLRSVTSQQSEMQRSGALNPTRQLAFYDAQGQPQDLGSVLGQKVVAIVINNHPDPYLPELADKYKDDAVILLVNPIDFTAMNTVAAAQRRNEALTGEPNLRAATPDTTGDQPISTDAMDAQANITAGPGEQNRNFYILIDKTGAVHHTGAISYDVRPTEAKNHDLSEAMLTLIALDPSTRPGGLDRPGQVGTPADRGISAATAGRMGQDMSLSLQNAHLLRTSALVGADIRSPANENLGEVESLLLDTSTGKIGYVMLSVGGFFDIGDKIIAVPWNAVTFSPGTEEMMTVNLTKDRVEQLPGMDEDDPGEQPEINDASWQQQNASVFGVAPQTYTQLIRVKDVKEFDIRNSAGENLGEIEDIMVDIRTGQVAFGVVEFGGFLEIGEKLVALPWNQFQIDAANESIRVDVPKERLQNAPNFDPDQWPGAEGANWSNNMLYFNQ